MNAPDLMELWRGVEDAEDVYDDFAPDMWVLLKVLHGRAETGVLSDQIFAEAGFDSNRFTATFRIPHGSNDIEIRRHDRIRWDKREWDVDTIAHNRMHTVVRAVATMPTRDDLTLRYSSSEIVEVAGRPYIFNWNPSRGVDYT